METCQSLQATEYYSALGSTRYLDLSLFREAGIRVRWQHLRPLFPDNRPQDYSLLDALAYLERGDILHYLQGPAQLQISEINAEL